MFSILLTPEYAPFAITFVVIVGIGLFEKFGLGLGHMEGNVDHGVGARGARY
jgi:hypothetical protein